MLNTIKQDQMECMSQVRIDRIQSDRRTTCGPWHGMWILSRGFCGELLGD